MGRRDEVAEALSTGGAPRWRAGSLPRAGRPRGGARPRAPPQRKDTAGSRVVELYDGLLDLHPSPVVALNRAVAVGMAEGPAPGCWRSTRSRRSGRCRGFTWCRRRAATCWLGPGGPRRREAAVERAVALAPSKQEQHPIGYLARRTAAEPPLRGYRPPNGKRGGRTALGGNDHEQPQGGGRRGLDRPGRRGDHCHDQLRQRGPAGTARARDRQPPGRCRDHQRRAQDGHSGVSIDGQGGSGELARPGRPG